VSLRVVDSPLEARADSARQLVVRNLLGIDGKPLGVVHAEYDPEELDEQFRTQSRQTEIFVLFGVLLAGAVLLAVHFWVLQPLEKIGKSLAVNAPGPVMPLTAHKSEFGRLANLVLTSFAQREALQHEIEERKRTEAALAQSESALREQIEHRAQLGRDLHDGVIQSLYAAGMGLAGIRSQLHPDQSDAAARLEQTRLALNETIHDVRNFIMGLEPEALKVQTFSSAVGALIQTMQGMRAFRSRRELDENLAGRLTLSQRVHALQIAREAISNALRHGKADEIQISLRQRDNHAEFTVRDNGQGFRAESAQPVGHGLSNFAQRAQELGGNLRVTSEPNQGTIVNLTFTLSI
jgi:signal transduction histidine kinase